MLEGKYDFSFTVPSQCAEALRTGEVDIAMAHRTRARGATPDVVARLDLLAEVARLLGR